MKILLWVLGVPIVVILLAAVLIPVFVDEQALVELAAERIEAESGIVLQVDGDAALSLFPTLSISATQVSIDLPDSKTSVTARSLAAGVALLPLLSRSVEIDSIMLDGLTLTSEAVDEAAAKAAAMDTGTLSDAELDAFYAARSTARQQAQAAAAASVLAVPLALEVGELVLTDIRVVTVDAAGSAISELQLQHLTARELNIQGRPVPLSASLLIPGEDGSPDIEVALAGEFTADLEAEQLRLDSLNVKVTGATAETLTLGLSGVVALTTQVADLQLTIESGSLQGEGSVRYASFESPQIDAKLTLNELNPALLLLAGPEAAATDTSSSDAAAGSDIALPLHALRMIDTRAQLTIEAVVLDVHKLEQVEATLRAQDGVIRLEPVTATVHGGKIDFNVVLNARYNTALFSTSGGVAELDIASAVTAAELGVNASGAASLDWTLEGSGSTVNTLTQSLAGPISFTTDDITVENVALQKMLCQGVALVNQESLTADFPADTTFEELSAQIQLADGVARLEPLMANLPGVALAGNGDLNLESQDLRASFRAQLSAELGEVDTACAINERYTQLRWPVECKGNLADDPASWCGVNTTEIIKDLAEGEVKRQLEDEAGKLLNKLFK